MPPTPRVTGPRAALLVVAIVLAAAMLRAPIVAVAPVARQISADLGVSAAVIGLFTSIPVLAFALCSPLAVALVRRGGANFALAVGLLGAVVGCLIRSADGFVLALVGTAVMGIFLTIGNVVIPVVIAREFPPERVHLMTGVYTSAINVGTMTVTVATAPLATGLGWRAAIAVWAVFGIAAVATWVALRGMRGVFVPHPDPHAARDAADGPRRSILRAGTTWALGAAFAGQAFSYYAMTAWLPTLLIDGGFGIAAAGAIAALFQVAGIAGALLTPLLTRRSIVGSVVLVAAGWATVPLGFLLAPDLWWLWCLLGGAAQGGGLTVIFIMISALGGDQHEVTGRSGLVQGLGYGVAAVGPTVVGALHEVSHGWTAPLLVVVAAVALFGVAGAGVAGRIRHR
ncbi:MAG: MFS transporter [Microbacterium sp.]|uniref:MFS transporter n=1 Tax=Microbacterium sp. TaxID=51671 RepID=UPI0026387268|nr:MFS transporter [Microbacterium sp.]MCX6503047.1 MFS transporter [Microbacterium sp.]